MKNIWVRIAGGLLATGAVLFGLHVVGDDGYGSGYEETTIVQEDEGIGGY